MGSVEVCGGFGSVWALPAIAGLCLVPNPPDVTAGFAF